MDPRMMTPENIQRAQERACPRLGEECGRGSLELLQLLLRTRADASRCFCLAEMKNMTPQQMEKMMAQVKNMDPSVLAGMGLSPEMLRQFEQLTPEEIAAQQAAMKNMSAEELAAATAQARAGMGGAQDSGRQQYYFGASQTLKNDGNKLVGCAAALWTSCRGKRRLCARPPPHPPAPLSSGKFAEAAEKYRRAKNNLAADSSTAGRDLRKSCILNLSLCLLKMGDAKACAAEACDALAMDHRSLKAYYRRRAARQQPLFRARPLSLSSPLAATEARRRRRWACCGRRCRT